LQILKGLTINVPVVYMARGVGNDSDAGKSILRAVRTGIKDHLDIDWGGGSYS
jgi:hypothetical protein